MCFKSKRNEYNYHKVNDKCSLIGECRKVLDDFLLGYMWSDSLVNTSHRKY